MADEYPRRTSAIGCRQQSQCLLGRKLEGGAWPWYRTVDDTTPLQNLEDDFSRFLVDDLRSEHVPKVFDVESRLRSLAKVLIFEEHDIRQQA